METSLKQVAEFHKVFNHPISDKPIIPDMKTVMFRINFIKEELAELEQAAKDGNLVEVADGLADIQYVLDGFFLNAGLHELKDKIMTEVHRSNMSKVCTSFENAIETIDLIEPEQGDCFLDRATGYLIIKRSSDGKVMKPTGYSKPDLKLIIGHVG